MCSNLKSGWLKTQKLPNRSKKPKHTLDISRVDQKWVSFLLQMVQSYFYFAPSGRPKAHLLAKMADYWSISRNFEKFDEILSNFTEWVQNLHKFCQSKRIKFCHVSQIFRILTEGCSAIFLTKKRVKSRFFAIYENRWMAFGLMIFEKWESWFFFDPFDDFSSKIRKFSKISWDRRPFGQFSNFLKISL